MGLLADLFGYVPPEQAPELVSIYPPQAMQKAKSGSLPTIKTDKIIMLPNEKCHYVDVGAVITKKIRRKTIHSGGSYRVFKGYTAHLGQSQSVPVEEEHYTKGVFYITNQRVIFVSSSNGFDKKIKTLTAVTAYSNGITLQFGNKTFTVLLPDGNTPKIILDLIL